MRTIQTARPRAELKEYVRVFALREMTCSGAGFTQADIACLEHILAFEFCDPIRIDGESKLVQKIHVAGSQTFPSGCAYFTGRHFAFGIFLKPLASWQLFRIPLATLANDNFDGRDLLGNGIHTLWLRLAESKTFEQRIKVAEDYLIPFAMNARAQTAIMKSARQMFRYKGVVRMEDLAHHSGLSLRQYERRFATEIGFAPKLFARITRFQAALDIKRLSPFVAKRCSRTGIFRSDAHNLGFSEPGRRCSESRDSAERRSAAVVRGFPGAFCTILRSHGLHR